MNAEFTRDELEELLSLAHRIVGWTAQDTLKPESAGREHLIKARQEYYKTWIDILNAHQMPISPLRTGGCTCSFGKDHIIRDDCMYHYAAKLQPWNHRIPWNCPTFYDGCNCKKGEDQD